LKLLAQPGDGIAFAPLPGERGEELARKEVAVAVVDHFFNRVIEEDPIRLSGQEARV
jgi:hypothetical protein